MKLLILTQKIDRRDDLLGFFHGWAAALASRFDEIVVIALGVGEYSLPANVKVLSLGKEDKKIFQFSPRPELGTKAIFNFQFFKKIKYAINFYRFIWRERKNYDSVFIHMNQEYAILGGWFWLLLGKKVALWRNHPRGGLGARLAIGFSDRVFCTSKEAFVARFKKTVIMPVGIDTLFYKKEEGIVRKPNSLLFLGRISPIKKPGLFIEALDLLNKEGIDFTASIVGDSLLKDADYYQELKDRVAKGGFKNKVLFEKSVNNKKTVEYFNRHSIYVNTTVSGSLDKTIFEAMSCESIVIVSNRSLINEIEDDFIFKENDSRDLADKIKRIILNREFNKDDWGKKLRDYVVENHSLNYLVQKIANE